MFELGDLELEQGGVLRGARLLYKTHGTLGAAKDNAILYPHMYSGTPSSLESTIGPGRALDPARYFVICPGQLGNGFSSSPSNTDGPFPDVLIGDDVVAQHRLVTESLGIEQLELVLGFSMGAQQSYEWAVRFPGAVARLAAIAGTAKTTPHCALAVELAEEALLAGRPWPPRPGLGASRPECRALPDGGVAGGRVRVGRGSGPAPLRRGLRADARGQSRLPVPQVALGGRVPRAQTATWRRRSRGSLRATFVIPFSHDLLFPVADCAAEQRLIAGSELRVIGSPWGHYAWEMTRSAREGLDQHLRELLGRSPDPALD